MEQNSATASRAADLAYEYVKKYGGCTQCVLAGVRDSRGGISDQLFRAGTGFAGGVALLGHNCGAFLAGTMVFGAFTGRDYDNFADPERKRGRTYELTQKLHRKFLEEYGSIECRDIQTRIMGRYFDLRDREQRAAFLEAGGHDDKCTSVSANAARWTVELLEGQE